MEIRSHESEINFFSQDKKITTFTELLVSAKHYSKYLAYINSYNLYKNIVR